MPSPFEPDADVSCAVGAVVESDRELLLTSNRPCILSHRDGLKSRAKIPRRPRADNCVQVLHSSVKSWTDSWRWACVPVPNGAAPLARFLLMRSTFQLAPSAQNASGVPLKRRRSTVTLLLVVLGVAACESLIKAEFDDLHVRVFTPCDARLNGGLPDEACTKAEGRPMACFAASQLGGEDYCVEYCDPRTTPADTERFSCFASGALLQNCDPDDAGTCPAGLNCFRTDIVTIAGFYPPQVKGICVGAPTCTDHADCTGTHNICGGELLRELFSPQSFRTNGLHCIQPCAAPNHECPDGESCLSTLIVFAEASDICVPNCDVKPCPPGYFCLANAGPGYPFGCATGFPGTKCSAPEDCMLGNCVAVDPALSVCTIDCETDGMCDVLPPVQGRFLCVNNHCVDKQTHLGIRCGRGDAVCLNGQHCSEYDPYAPGVPRLTEDQECRSWCKSDGTCDPVGGMPRVCLPNDECYPGDMGLPCKKPGECMGEFSCECVENCDTPETATRICTKPCTSDAQCVGYNTRVPDRCVDGLCRLRPR